MNLIALVTIYCDIRPILQQGFQTRAAMENLNWKWIAAVASAGVGVASFGALYFMKRFGYQSYQKDYPDTFKRLDDPLSLYVTDQNLENSTLAKLRQLSVKHEEGEMTTSVEVGNLLTILCKTLNARKVIDVGAFTGCSAFSMALGLPDDGKVIACDVSEEFTSIAKPYWEEGGVTDKIDLRLQPATQTLQELLDNGEKNTFDLIFIDADKQNYGRYYEMGLQLLRTGGLIVVDNALWGGMVADQTDQREKTMSIRELNRKMKGDKRIKYALLYMSDGVGLALKL